MKKVILGVIASLSLSACISTGGKSAYTVKPIVLEDGKVICCNVDVNNTKDYDKLKMKFSLKPDGTINFTLDEDGVDASTPATIQAQQNKVLVETLINGVLPTITQKQ